jgi:aspartate racemase
MFRCIKPASKIEYLRIIEALAHQGAEAVILGCTEIGMLVKQTDTKVLLLDTTYIHAQKAVEYALIDVTQLENNYLPSYPGD